MMRVHQRRVRGPGLTLGASYDQQVNADKHQRVAHTTQVSRENDISWEWKSSDG